MSAKRRAYECCSNETFIFPLSQRNAAAFHLSDTRAFSTRTKFARFCGGGGGERGEGKDSPLILFIATLYQALYHLERLGL